MVDQGDGGGPNTCNDPTYCENGKPKTKADENKIKDEFVKTLNDLAIVTQDIATTIDAGFSIIELGLIAVGCLASSEIGCVEGAAGGMLLGQIIWNLEGGNAVETGLGLASLLFTATADVLDDGEIGEAITTSMVTFGLGTLTLDPIGDLLIDGYASGYNHKIFNGVETLFSGGPLLKR